jgi:DNA-binding NtrC family response regulator
LEALCRYDWPGNVRELANLLERAQILAENQTITLDDLPEHFADAHPPANVASAHAHYLREVERRHVLEILRQQHGNKVHTAKELGISRRALYRLLHKYHITSDQIGAEPAP